MVSRAIFVPPDLKEKAFDDSPIKKGIFHLSAPHMYAIVLEALNIQPGLYLFFFCFCCRRKMLYCSTLNAKRTLFTIE